MKTLNSKNIIKKTRIFRSKSTGEYLGFAGLVDVYDEKIYVDTRDGTGNTEVINKLRPLIHKFSKLFFNEYVPTKDTEHDVIVHILEGIHKYDPRKNTKLSTFLQMRVGRRLINELRDKGYKLNNATLLNVKSYHVICNCGNNFNITIGSDSEEYYSCKACGTPISKAKKKMSRSFNELPREFVGSDSQTDSAVTLNIDYQLVDQNKILSLDDKVIKTCDVNAWLDGEDPKIKKIIELICFEDFTIKDAAEKVGLTGTWANIKLKKLKDNKRVKELFGR